jgi:phosphohistidine phosphatase
MKTLLLMRHAKSSWGDESLPDFERPLNERGNRDAPRIGQELAARGVVPDVIVTSTAVRAVETTRLVCKGLDEARGSRGQGRGKSKEGSFKLEPSLYGAPPDRILEAINLLPNKCSCALIVGHNPGMQDLVTSLIGQWLPEGMKTATVACIQFEAADWPQVGVGAGKFKWILYPGQLKEELEGEDKC